MTDINIQIGTEKPIDVTIDKTGPRGEPGSGINAEQIQSKNVPAPTDVNHGNALAWNKNTNEFEYDAYEPLGAVATHNAATIDVHGIADTSTLTQAAIYKLVWEVGSERLWPSVTPPTAPGGAGGWLIEDGRTLGNNSSSADLMGLDYHDLFVFLWNNFANAELPIKNSDGTAGSRGASAQADWDANKRMPLPTRSGRTPVAYKSGDANFGAMGKNVGAATHGHSISDPGHNHDLIAYGKQWSLNGGADQFRLPYYSDGGWDDVNVGSRTTGITVGPDTTNSNIQPSSVTNWIMKY